jgi:serine/threonine-protein kinase
MGEHEAAPIKGTEGGVDPFFSPDGEWVGFWAEGKLQKVRVEGGPPVPICEVARPFGASWGLDNNIYMGQGPVRDVAAVSIIKVSATGGELQAVNTAADHTVTHSLPQLLPDGKTLLFTTNKINVAGAGSWDGAEIVTQSLETGSQKVLMKNGADARYVPTGHLVFVREGTLLAAPFDLKRLEITGGAVVVVEDVRQAINVPHSLFDTGAGQFSFSASGTLVYAPGGIFPDFQASFVWIDRKGNVEPVLGPTGSFVVNRLSPDGRRVAVHTSGYKNDNIWIFDIARGTLTRLTLEEETAEHWPTWTPDGARITYASNRGGRFRIYEVPADGSGPEQCLISAIRDERAPEERLSASGFTAPGSWSPDGQVLAFYYIGEIWTLPRDREPSPFLQLPFFVQYPEFSPDGRWLVYVSNFSGRREVYVTSYPGPGPKIQISVEGGMSPAWSRDGREIFFWGLDDGEGLAPMMVVDVTTDPVFSVGKPRELFKVESTGYVGAMPFRSYDVTSDGRKFLMLKQSSRVEEPVTELSVVLNWFEELKRLAPSTI